MSRPFNEFHRRALSALARDIAQARIEQREGGARIDTHCLLCPPPSCAGDCQQGRRECDCAVQLAQMPSPLEPQPVQISKPSLWQRLCAWYRKHIDNGKTYD